MNEASNSRIVSEPQQVSCSDDIDAIKLLAVPATLIVIAKERGGVKYRIYSFECVREIRRSIQITLHDFDREGVELCSCFLDGTYQDADPDPFGCQQAYQIVP